jgi:hypothetical protein
MIMMENKDTYSTETMDIFIQVITLIKKLDHVGNMCPWVCLKRWEY